MAADSCRLPVHDVKPPTRVRIVDGFRMLGGFHVRLSGTEDSSASAAGCLEYETIPWMVPNIAMTYPSPLDGGPAVIAPIDLRWPPASP
jgi:hypothetical protein